LDLAGLYAAHERQKRTLQIEDIDKSLKAHARGSGFVKTEMARVKKLF